MNTNSNIYTIIYSTLLVVIVAALLAFVSTSLKERQQTNIDTEKRTNILMSVNLVGDLKNVDNLNKHIDNLFSKYIIDSYVIDYQGNRKNESAFDIDLKAQSQIIKKMEGGSTIPESELKQISLPVYICKLDNGEIIEIFSVYGAGLWGPIWGYVALKSDMNTVYGAFFNHAGETPGLGAEIATTAFSGQFANKEIFPDNTFSSIIIKKGGATPGSKNEVDAITGGTITSNALQTTIMSWLKCYSPYLQDKRESGDSANQL